ncbi:MAG TPA: MMPL family transporter [Gemmataceae bacterium]|nr:MMPL family transporter [Gemmataceae bacterium]
MNPEQAHGEATTIVGRWLARLATTVGRRPRLVLAAVAAICAVSVYTSWTRLEYQSQRDDLINPNKEVQQRWRRYLAEFGRDDDMVVVVQGANRQRMKDALEALAERVRQQPEHFDRLFYKVDLRHLHNRALLYLSSDQLRQIQDSLKSMGPLLDGPLSFIGWRVITLQNLVREADDRVARLKPGEPLSKADEQFLTQLLSISRSARATLIDPADYRNAWASLLSQPPEQQDLLAEPQYFFSPDGELAFLLVRPINGEKGSFTADRRSIEAMRALIAEVRPAYPELEFGLTGLPVLETDEMVASQRDSNLASWLAMAGVAVLYLVVFRGLRYPLMTVATLLVGIVVALGWMTLTVGHLNILSAAFAVMLIGMGDYGVLWVTRYEQDRQAGADVPTALRRTAGSVGPGILTAALTTALAFYATMLADFKAVAELGWIAGSGVLFCAISCFTVMPALLTVTDRRPAQLRIADCGLRIDMRQPATSSVWLPALAGRPRWVIVGSLLIAGVLAACACRVHYDHNLLNLQARGLDSVAWEMKLIRHTAGASWHALSYCSTSEEARALRERYERLPVVSRVVEVASLVPSDQEAKLEQLRDIRRRLSDLPRRGAPIVPLFPTRAAALEADLARLIDRLGPLVRAGPGTLPGELCLHLTALGRQLAAMPTALADQRLRQFDQRLAGDLAEDLHRLRDVSTPIPIAVADLPPALRERYIGSSGKWLLRIFAADCLWEHDALVHFVEEIRKVDPEATGKPFLTLEGLEAMKSGFQWASVYALAAIATVLLLDFRSVRHTFWALAPLALGTVATLGVLGLLGVPLNPANMIAFPLIVGVGVDNGVHVLHDYLAQGARRHYTLSRPIGRGILVAALTTVLGFGTLMISSHRGLVGLGLVLSLGVSCCTTTALVFLPALLRLRGVQTPAEEPAAAPADRGRLEIETTVAAARRQAA